MKPLKSIFPISFSMLVIYLVYCVKIVSLKYYPVAMNFIFFMIFFSSSFRKETAIQKIIKRVESDCSDYLWNYGRKLNYIWALITFVNLSLSFCTLFLSPKIWAVYNGFISYCIIGLAFCIEYIVRISYKRRIIPEYENVEE